MKRTYILLLICIFSLMSIGSASSCLGFFNGSTCVEFCPLPKVNDITTQMCLDNVDACTDAYFPIENVCLKDCPHQTILGFSPTGKRFCLPLDIQTINPNASGLTCSTSQYLNLITTQCTAMSTPCSGVLIPQIRVCLATCPFEYTKVTTKDQNNNDVQTCVLKPYAMPAACTGTQIRNRATNACLNNISACVGFYVDQMKSCETECPLDFPVVEAVANATYSNCKAPVNPCTNSQIQKSVSGTITCLNNLSECTTFYLEDKNICIDKCPAGSKSTSVNGQSYQLCEPCPLQDQQGNCYEICPESMKLDLQRHLCLSGTSEDCKENEYFVKLTSSCVGTCPFGTLPSQSNSPKECVPCAQTSAGCPDQSTQCSMKLSDDKKVCGEECPNLQFALPKSGSQTYYQCKLCQSTSQFVNEAGDACVSSCDGNLVGDRATRRCINQSDCLGFVFTENNMKQCGKACPKGQLAAAPVANVAYSLCTACADGTFLNESTKTCVSSCQLYDANKTSCLASINDCRGFISQNQLTCSTSCAAGEVFFDGARSGQFQCSKSCPSSTFLSNGQCFKQCLKGTYADKSTQSCIDISKCANIVSFDGKNCVTSCEPGQFVQIDEKSKAKVCKICNEKISADGSKCASECGASEVFDFDLKKCFDPSNANTCNGKIYSADKKSCSSQCPKGQLLTVNASSVKQCLSSVLSCANIVSADLTQCVTSCQSNEAVVTMNTTKFCRPCPYGPNDSKTACKSAGSCNGTTPIFDLDLGTCVDAASCSTKLLSVDGLKCGTKCQFPEVTRLSVSTTQCYSDCGSGEIRVPGKGCVASSECTGYISAGNGSCVQECIHVREVVDSTTSVPKTCKLCAETETPTVVDKSGTKVIQCSTKTSSDPSLQTTGMKDIIGLFSKIEPEQKANIKKQVSSVSDTVEAAVKALKTNLELTQPERNAQMKSYLDDLKNIAKQFSSKVEQTTGSEENQSQLILGSSEYSLVTETLKAGNVFNVKFSLNDFLSSQTTSLQVDPATLKPDALVSTTSAQIKTLQAINQATNPHCSDSTKCSSYGLFSIDYTLENGSRRQLSASDGQVFTIVYSVPSSNIKKSICVSFDETTGEMTPAASTSVDTNKSTIACSFYTNSDIYLDSSCQYIDQSFCSVATPVKNEVTVTTNNNNEPSSAFLHFFSMTLFVALFAFITL